MDDGLTRAVREAFVRLYREDLVYRGRYIINWCPRCHTALAEIEVEYTDRDGELAHLAYPASDGSMEAEKTGTSTGKPPASQTPAFTFSASSRR